MSAPKTFIVTSAYSTPLNGTAPEEVMYMPAGKSVITPSVDGKAKKITVNVSKETADILQASLTQLLTEPVSPFVDFSHKGEESAATPTSFRWDDRGVVMAVDWSAAGRSAIEGRVFRHISPTFLINESGEPCGLPEGPIAALTNRPAFKQNAKISASDEGATTGDDEPPKLKGKKKMADETAETVTAALRTELEALRAENKTLRETAETQRVEAINRDADLLIEAAVKDGKIAPKNETVKASLKRWAVTDLAGAKAHIESLPVNPAFKTVVTVTSAHRDVGKPPINSADSGGSSGKLCNAKVQAIRSQFPNMTYEEAWRKAEAEFPDLFQKVEA
jgi:phage I-like protein